ncbi:MAG: valine--pyruvate transaminase, partial [Gammaproteobacteria bacterium]
AIFLWLWFEALPITSEELYQRLKTRGVLVVAGEHFFPGLNTPWAHRHECIRVSYALNPDHLQRGIKIIAEEVARAYAA